MNIIGYTGVSRGHTRSVSARESLLRHHKEGHDPISSFLDYAPEDGRVPINFFPLRGLGHDCAAAILTKGKLIAAVAEERLNRRKHSISLDGENLLPLKSLGYCLDFAEKSLSEIDYFCHYLDLSEPTMKKRLEILRSVLPAKVRDSVIRANEESFATEFSRENVFNQLQAMVGEVIPVQKFQCIPHHLSHAAASYYSSGFEAAGVLTLDGYGEKDSALFALGNGQRLEPIESIEIPHSLGILYMIVTVFLGFKALNDEYKVMGLAPHGNPVRYRSAFRDLILIDEKGGYQTPLLTQADLSERLVELFGLARKPDDPISQREMDIAASLQERLEEVVLSYLRRLKYEYAFEKLCISGGVALNSVLNGKIARAALFKDIYVFPAAGDDGCAVGAAQYLYHHVLGETGQGRITSVLLGHEYENTSISKVLAKFDQKITIMHSDDIAHDVAELILDQQVVGWFQGRMEFGPRALGNRSILGDARNPEMKNIINEKVKWREPFRPFAPAVKDECVNNFFEMIPLSDSPFMLFVVPVTECGRYQIPATTHVDGTARVQTVKRSENTRFWQLLDWLERKSEVGVVLNTSFNVKGEPIVCSPEDALRCFLNTNIDVLAIGDFIVRKRTEVQTNGI